LNIPGLIQFIAARYDGISGHLQDAKTGVVVSGSLQHLQRESQGKSVHSASVRKSDIERIVVGGCAVYTLDTFDALIESAGRIDCNACYILQ